MSDFTFGDDLRRRVEDNMAAFEARAVDDDSLRRAAVIIVIVGLEAGDQAGVLLTYRPPNLRRHAGQYALPGGRMDDGETVAETALRELREELGMTLDADRIIGALDDYPTRSGFRITSRRPTVSTRSCRRRCPPWATTSTPRPPP